VNYLVMAMMVFIKNVKMAYLMKEKNSFAHQMDAI